MRAGFSKLIVLAPLVWTGVALGNSDVPSYGPKQGGVLTVWSAPHAGVDYTAYGSGQGGVFKQHAAKMMGEWPDLMESDRSDIQSFYAVGDTGKAMLGASDLSDMWAALQAGGVYTGYGPGQGGVFKEHMAKMVGDGPAMRAFYAVGDTGKAMLGASDLSDMWAALQAGGVYTGYGPGQGGVFKEHMAKMVGDGPAMRAFYAVGDTGKAMLGASDLPDMWAALQAGGVYTGYGPGQGGVFKEHMAKMVGEWPEDMQAFYAVGDTGKAIFGASDLPDMWAALQAGGVYTGYGPGQGGVFKEHMAKMVGEWPEDMQALYAVGE